MLRHFNTDSAHYDVIFTSGCTAALKLLAESFPWRGVGDCHGRDDSRMKTSENLSQADKSRHQEVVGQTGLGTSCKTGLTACSSEKPTEVGTTHRTEVAYLPGTRVCETGGELFSVESENDESSVFCYLEDNHTSVVGMRELASHYGARVVCTTAKNIKKSPPAWKEQSSAGERTGRPEAEEWQPPFHLFAYPAQSNFSGQKYPLSWSKDLSAGDVYISRLERLSGSWLVVVDAASYVCTSPLDLTLYPAHFVTLSFYKMFGYPTGLGALLVRSDCARLLRRDYYGGGTVLATVSRTGLHVPRPQLHER